MSYKFIGHDVSVFSAQALGQDLNPSSGASSSYLGRWESVEITLTNDWSTVSSSDAIQPEKRWKMASFTGSLKTWIDAGGSQQLELFGIAQLVFIVFTDGLSGKTMFCRAGITKAGATWGADNGKDSLDFEDVGSTNFGGLPTFGYA